MGKKIVLEVAREPYVYDGSPEAGRKAFARAHAPYKCGLCPEWVKPGTPHRHFDDQGEFHAVLERR